MDTRWRSRCIFSLRSGRGRVWGFGGGIGSRGDSASQVATLSPHVFPCTSTGLSSNRASDPLSLKLAQTPADSLHAGMLAGCGGVHGIGGTRRVAGEAGMDFDFLFWSSACALSNAARCSCDAACCGLCCSTRSPSLRGSLHAEPNSFYFARRHDCRLAPAPGRRSRGCRPACVHKAQQCRYFRAIHSTSGTTW